MSIFGNHNPMDQILTSRLCTVAHALTKTHGTFFAACLLAEHGVPLALALESLTRKSAGKPAKPSYPETSKVIWAE